MALSRYLWFLTFMVARAQKPPDTVDAPPTPSSKSTPVTLPTTKILSYHPSQVCFNPQYDLYFKNDLLATCPIPKPNVYFDNQPAARTLSCPKSADQSFRGNLPPFVAPWSNNMAKNFVPLVYIPSIPSSGHIDRRMLSYLKRLKKALNENPLLEPTNTAATSPKNRVEIKFGSFPPADALPEALSKGTGAVEPTTAKELEALRVAEQKAQKMASHLIDYGRRRQRRENVGSNNVYPLPKFEYGDNRISEPTTTYSFNQFLTEMYHKNG